MKKMTLNNWVILSFTSLLIVATLGVLMRYKIGFSFPYFLQKNLQYAHSHFAFAGWISQTLFVFMMHIISNGLNIKRIEKYNNLLWANWVTAVAMLIAFGYQGYGLFSIALSSMSIIISFTLSVMFWKDLRLHPNEIAVQWFKYSMFYMIVSTLGTLSLIIMTVSKTIDQYTYLASVYWYLHFQYNGWFLFACMGLVYSYFGKQHVFFSTNRLALRLLAISCLPAYGLSVLWLHLPLWVEIAIAIAAITQTIGWCIILYNAYKSRVFNGNNIKSFTKWLLIIVAFSGSVKFLLQLGSTIPEISKVAFGFRPIVIAYLHLVLLAFISLFLVTYSFIQGLAKVNRISIWGITIFVAGIASNEILLAAQGVASFSYTIFPQINAFLFLAASLLLLGAILLLVSQLRLSIHK